MNTNEQNHQICQVERAGALDNGLRRLVQNPRKILNPFIREGMTVLDIGCGPGFFSVEIAKMLNGKGKVIAADAQEGMLHSIEKECLTIVFTSGAFNALRAASLNGRFCNF